MSTGGRGDPAAAPVLAEAAHHHHVVGHRGPVGAGRADYALSKRQSRAIPRRGARPGGQEDHVNALASGR